MAHDPAVAAGEDGAAAVWIQGVSGDEEIVGALLPSDRMFDDAGDVAFPIDVVGSSPLALSLTSCGSEYFLLVHDSPDLYYMFLDSALRPITRLRRISDGERVARETYDAGYDPVSNRILVVWQSLGSEGQVMRQWVHAAPERTPIGSADRLAPSEGQQWRPRISVGTGDSPFLVAWIDGPRGWHGPVKAALLASDGSITSRLDVTSLTCHRVAAAYDPDRNRHYLLYSGDQVIRGTFVEFDRTGTPYLSPQVFVHTKILRGGSPGGDAVPDSRIGLTFNRVRGRYLLAYIEAQHPYGTMFRERWPSVLYTLWLNPDNGVPTGNRHARHPGFDRVERFFDLDSNDLSWIVYESNTYSAWGAVTSSQIFYDIEPPFEE